MARLNANATAIQTGSPSPSFSIPSSNADDLREQEVDRRRRRRTTNERRLGDPLRVLEEPRLLGSSSSSSAPIVGGHGGPLDVRRDSVPTLPVASSEPGIPAYPRRCPGGTRVPASGRRDPLEALQDPVDRVDHGLGERLAAADQARRARRRRAGR